MSPRDPRGTTFRIRYVDHPTRKAKWSVSWNVYTPGRTGRPAQRSAWFTTEADAEEFRRRTIAALAHAAAGAPTRKAPRRADSLAVLADDWLARVQKQREAATYRSYAYVVKHYLAPEPGHKRYPGLGNLAVHDGVLTKKLIVEYLEDLYAQGVSLSGRRGVKRALSALCSYALFAGRLTGANPCAEVGRTIRQKGEATQEPQPNPFTPEEISRLFDQLAAAEDLPIRAFCRWQYDIGTRPGEATALQWSAIDFVRKRAHIRASYCTTACRDKDPKTHEVRWVDLTDAVVELLLEWRAAQRQEAFRSGLPAPVYVFTTRLVARHTVELARIKPGGNIQLILARVFKACGITGHTLYDFRDSFATSHLVNAWDRKIGWVSKQLGHKTPLTTAAHYYAYRDTRASRGFADEERW